MRAKLVAGVGFVAALGVAGFFVFRGGGGGGERAPASDTVPAPPTSDGPRATPSPNLPEQTAPASIAGTVRDAFTRQPVGGVEIRFAGDAEVTVTSGDDGRFETSVEPGRYAVTAAGEMLVGSRADTLLVAAGARVTDLEVTVLAAATVDGRVVDGDGAPMRGVEVGCVAPVSCIAVSGDDGRFQVIVSPGRVELAAEVEGRPRASLLLRWVEPGAQLSGVELVLDNGARITGRVTDRKATVVLSGEVTAWLGERLVGAAPVEGGAFSISGLPAGKVGLVASAPGYGPTAPHVVDVLAGDRVEVTLAVGDEQRLRGTVVDPDGAPAGGARVAVRPPGSERDVGEQTTGDDGRFDIGGLGFGPYDLIAEKTGLVAARRAAVGASAEGIELKLLAAGGISGAVQANGAPVVDFTVLLVQTAAIGGGATAGAQQLRFAAPDGVYRIEGIEPGSYDLSVSAPGFAPALTVGLAVPPGGFADGSASLSQGATVAGTVTNGQNHRPIFGAEVSMATGHIGESAFTDSGGRFEIADVAPGRRSVEARHPSFVGHVESGVELAAGDRRPLDIVLQPRDSSDVDPAGEPIEFAGIGAAIAWSKDRLVVQDVLPHTPAEVAGLQPADQIVAIDGVPVKGRGLGAGVEDIRGVAGTAVRLRIERAGVAPFQLDVVRATIRYAGGE